MRARFLMVGQVLLAVIAVVGALGIVRGEVSEQTSSLTRPVDVPAGGSVDIVVSGSDAEETLEGSFRVEEVTDHARLTPLEDYDDPVERAGGRVVVAGVSCDCPTGEDLLPPTSSVVDSRGREWKSEQLTQPRPDSYAELEGYSRAFDLGEEAAFRYAVVVIVPADVADEVRLVLHRDPGPAHRFAR